MTDPLKKLIKELDPTLSDECIDKLIKENERKIAIILYEAYNDGLNIRDNANSQSSWAGRSKFYIDDCRFSVDESTRTEISTYQTCQEKFTEMGETAKADKFTKIITGYSEGLLKIQENRRYAVTELTGIIAQEEGFKKDTDEVTRKMKEVVSK